MAGVAMEGCIFSLFKLLLSRKYYLLHFGDSEE